MYAHLIQNKSLVLRNTLKQAHWAFDLKKNTEIDIRYTCYYMDFIFLPLPFLPFTPGSILLHHTANTTTHSKQCCHRSYAARTLLILTGDQAESISSLLTALNLPILTAKGKIFGGSYPLNCWCMSSNYIHSHWNLGKGFYTLVEKEWMSQQVSTGHETWSNKGNFTLPRKCSNTY